ncbi:putative dipeptidyl-aminopeptidase B [Lineolata rhizophorae]|uniref:dipeptidyl-peptidase IV n=1 Tax=Lineolata rhizophorae TaxID=578093 RepID=A0A6A6P7K9_9PEZI|nr:putative dipeptidyl-aminopeptidase B [Lineolata rhizophorae]
MTHGTTSAFPRGGNKLHEFDVEDQQAVASRYGHGVPGKWKPVDKKARRYFWMLGTVCVVGWLLALIMFLSRDAYRHPSTQPHDPQATQSRGSGKKVTLDQVMSGAWSPRRHHLSWIAGANGEDGLLLERGQLGQDYLVVEHIRKQEGDSSRTQTLMEQSGFYFGSSWVMPDELWPSPDLKKVLIMSEKERNWRHSYRGKYWILDVTTQQAEPLDPKKPHEKIQLATWSPLSNAIVFTRKNNMYYRKLDSDAVHPITTDGGPELFYGVPDWVYEEEVLASNRATWWSKDGQYIAFFRTNETQVPTYPVQYFISRPSGKQPPPGLENYPEVREIKYPKAGAPNPTVNLWFYDIRNDEMFSMDIEDDYPDHDRLITEVVWAGRSKKVIVRETNRESDLLKVVIMDVERRRGKTVRTRDVNAIDGGWFEVSQTTKFIPSDPGNGRPHDGYIDTVIHDGYDHLAYFTPLDNPDPIQLTSGQWEVENAPSAVDLKHNVVYFVATKESPIQRHIYSVKLDGSDLKAITDTSKEGFYEGSFSTGTGYVLLSYDGPDIPWQKVINTDSNPDPYQNIMEENKELAIFASEHELPLLKYQTVTVDGFDLNVVERRPPHFDPNKKYPVLFYLYGGPTSQMVKKTFHVDFQSYVASSLGYVVVTVDGRGTGFMGRKARCIIRGDIGYYESRDQIEAAKMWAQKQYIDEDKMAIWGWSYGGFMTLKTLERDAGNTFKYGMAVAPVTDWRFYDSIYTERYMHKPQNNEDGYNNASISDTAALSQNVRFLIMHGVADDNVHMQNTLTLLDKLDLDGVENYDVHVFPDSDHGIYFHNANRIVYDKLSSWLINAFNGQWLKVNNPKPVSLDRLEMLS